MKRILLFLIGLGLFVSSCSILEPNTEGVIKGNGLVTLKFVQVNDVYEIAPLNGGEYGGMARVAHIRDSIKKQFPNTYLFMAGDFLNPSLLGTLKVDGERLNGKQMVDVMNAMDFDLVTFGNHELDLSEEDLQKRLDESTFKWTSANVRHVTEDGIEPFSTKLEFTKVPISDFATFKAIDPNGNEMKFGVVSVTLPSNPKEYVYYGDIYKEAFRAYKLATEKTDLVFGLTHVSIEEDRELARLMQSIPLIMGGHEHNAMLVNVGKTTIAKADANAKSVYVHTILFNPKTKYYNLHSQLVFVDEKTPSNAKVERIVSKWNDMLDEKLKEVVDNPNEVIYNPSIPLDGTDSASRSIQTNLGEIITKSMAFSYQNKVDAAIVNGGSIRVDDMLSGPITPKDVFRVLPFGGSVLKVDLKGNLLKEILDYGQEKKGTGAYLQRDNISEASNGDWLIQGKPISEKKTYTIAISDFLLKGLDIPFLTPENKDIVEIYTPKETETAADIRKAIIFYLNSLKK
ncbi:bifunctional metallophosphatase/5'-nucleotidase [Aequorivita soesokkakensis]|uniref:bifunctional metallophosphatase/5'-nucleotidase n=1 Tax=Aequorivita soesokkakensis TaxID=1385699 RepID=UPI000A52F911|nr:bifunctional metallophosphatase/5'-nucleotidase [Aequorivita soesokkakensis]